MQILSKKNKAGCPVCNGVAARACMRCGGKTKMWHWFSTKTGWEYFTQLEGEELIEAEKILQSF